MFTSAMNLSCILVVTNDNEHNSRGLVENLADSCWHVGECEKEYCD